MSIALDPKTERIFITTGDQKLKEAEQTWWKVRDLSERERIEFMDALGMRDDGTGGAVLAGSGSRTYIGVKNGLMGVESNHPLKDVHGKVIPFETDKDGRVSDEFLERVDWRDKREISDDITRNLTLLGADVEKSAPSPTDS